MQPTSETSLPFEGQTLASLSGCEEDSEEVVFTTEEGDVYRMYHLQDCCEDVRLNEVIGDPCDLLGTPLVSAKESWREATSEEAGESGTWTFYNFRTAKGDVTLRWLGTSNGYYSEGVSVREVNQCY